MKDEVVSERERETRKGEFIGSDAVALPPETVAMLKEMDTAIAEEIASKSKNKGYSRVARQGQAIEQSGIHYIYEFTLDEFWEPDDDTPLRIQIPGAPAMQATVVSARGVRLKMATEQALPPSALDRIDLIDNPTQLLERLREALKDNTEGPLLLGSKTFGTPLFTSARRDELGLFPGFCPRASQTDAMKLSLGSEVAFIIGPPGTGKTSTLAAIAYALASEGRSVLIVAHTNIAVDNAIIRLGDMCEKGSLPALKEGRIIRYGAPQINAIKNRDDIYPAKIVKRLAQELGRQRDDLEIQRVQRESQLKTITERDTQQTVQWDERRASLLIQREARGAELVSLQASERERVAVIDAQLRQVSQAHTQAGQSLESARGDLTTLVSQQSEVETAHTQHRAMANDLARRLAAAQQMSRIGRLVRGMNLNQLARQLADARQLIWSDEQTLGGVGSKLVAAHQRVAEAQREWNAAQAKLANLQAQRRTSPKVESQITALNAEVVAADKRLADGDRAHETQSLAAKAEQADHQKAVEDLSKRIAELDERLREIERRLLDEAQVVATTLTTVYMNQRLRERRFDYVIMDEVSMAPLPSVYIAASRADLGVTAIGDPRQLAPIATSETPMARKWLKRDLFGVVGIKLEPVERLSDRCSLLDVQSRMHPDISVIANKHVYNGQLKDESQRAKGYDQIKPLPERRLILCDTGDASPVTSRPGKSSRINLYHALAALAVARQILVSLPPREFDPDKPYRIGIATPYRAQANLIQRMVKADGLERVVHVGTVHRFQGLEFEAMIFDTVEAPPLPSATKFIGGGKESEGQCLVNVAVTRPQHKLVIIANAQYIAKQFNRDDTLLLAVEEAGRSATIPSHDVLGALADFAEQPVTNLPGMTAPTGIREGAAPVLELLTEEAFYERFFGDMQVAQSKIVIMAPFVRDMRTSEVALALKARVEDGVQVIVVASEDRMTPPVDAKARRSLEQAGVKFRTSPGMHDKVVFIDDEIVFWGSLNPLSHFGTTEFMARIESRSQAQAIAKIVNAGVRADPVKWGQDVAILTTDIPPVGGVCPKCGGELRRKGGRYGPYYGCSNYHGNTPQSCRFSTDVPEEMLAQVLMLTNILCDKCNAGMMRPHAERKDRWLECAADSPCGHRRKIVFEG